MEKWIDYQEKKFFIDNAVQALIPFNRVANKSRSNKKISFSRFSSSYLKKGHFSSPVSHPGLGRDIGAY